VRAQVRAKTNMATTTLKKTLIKRKNIVALFTMLKDQLVSLETKEYFCFHRGTNLKSYMLIKAPSLVVIKVALFLNPSKCLFS
jgi:hypothetical protein